MSGKTSNASKAKYNGKTYDYIKLAVRKDDGQKQRYQDAAEAAGESLTAYITQAVEERISRENQQSVIK